MRHAIRLLCRIPAAGIFCLAWLAGLDAQAQTTNVYSGRQVMESWGWLAAHQQNLAGIEISRAEEEVFLMGFAAGLKKLPAPCDLPSALNDVQQLAHARREKLIHAEIQKNEAVAKSFFAGLRTNDSVRPLTEGVCYQIVHPGGNARPQPAQTVTLNYIGHLLDGTEFVQVGPLDVVLVTNRNICRGWTDALQKIGSGGSLKLFVPPPLSEKEGERWGVPPGSALVFDIQMLSMRNTDPADLANARLPAAPEPPEPLPSGCSQRLLLQTWGWSVARSLRLERYGLQADELKDFTAGLAGAMTSDPPPVDPANIYLLVRQAAGERREKVRAAIRQKQLATMNTLFAQLQKNPRVVTLPDGLRYEILQPGTGAHPKTGQMVLVNYTGRLPDQTIFDQTYNEPLHILVGSVIPGWNEGIQHIGRGGKLRLYVPPALGYGSEDHSGVVAPIPADSTLIYEIELLDVRDAPSADAPAVSR